MGLIAQETTPLELTVTRGEEEMVVPAEPTPREEKPLSDIDDPEWLRFQMYGIFFYKHDPSMEGRDPVKVVKEALAKALVFYYPFAGRLKEGPNRKLIVDCTGDGVPFFAADANVTLEDFGEAIHPPFPLDQLLYNIPGSDGMVGTPLLIFQVTRLKCGGFIVALRKNHVMADGNGVVMLLKTMGEMAKGFSMPSALPVWERERLMARDPLPTNIPILEFDESEHHHANGGTDLVHQTFLLGSEDIAALRSHIPPQIKHFSTFDILSATLWRCRTIALGIDPDLVVNLCFAVNARAKFNPPLPSGYYGNACAFPDVEAKVRDITNNSVGYCLELIRKAKAEIDEEYVKTSADIRATYDETQFNMYNTYDISDARHLGFTDVDFGWGKPVFGGPASNGLTHDATFLISYKNKKGQSMIMVPICLPSAAMEVFVKEFQSMLKVRS